MEDFLVLGIVPFTDTRISFEAWLVLSLSIISTVVALHHSMPFLGRLRAMRLERWIRRLAADGDWLVV